MDVIYGLIPGMLILGLVGVAVFFWAAKSGQFEDLEGEANRILMDDDLSQRKPDHEGDNGRENSDQEERVKTAASGEAVTDVTGEGSDDQVDDGGPLSGKTS